MGSIADTERPQDRLDTTFRIAARHPIRNAFAGCSSGPVYYETKGHAVSAFEEALAAYNLHFDEMSGTTFSGDEGWTTVAVCNGFDAVVGYARLSWYRLESGRYEFTGYIT